MQRPTSFDMMNLEDNITIAATRSRCHNVLVEGKWNKKDEDQKIDNRADSAHGLWSSHISPIQHNGIHSHDRPLRLGHVLSTHPSLNKNRTKPSDHAIRYCKGNAAECNGWCQRGALSFALVDQDAETGTGQDQKSPCFPVGKGVSSRGSHLECGLASASQPQSCHCSAASGMVRSLQSGLKPAGDQQAKYTKVTGTPIFCR